MTTSLELPSHGDPALDPLLAHLEAESVLAACQEQFPAGDSAGRRSRRCARAIEALYHPGRYVRVAYAFLPDSSIPNHRVWPQGEVVYLHAPVRRPMSSRGVVLQLGGMEVEMYRFPNDRRLRGLRKFAAQRAATAIWQDWLDQDGAEERLEPQTLQRFLLRYVPEQKWVVRLRAEPVHHGGGKVHKRRITVRCASPSLCATLLNRHQSLRRCAKESKSLFHAARVVGYDAQLGLLAVKWAHGLNLVEMLQEQEPTDVMRKVVATLQSFHASGISDLPSITPAILQRQIQESVDDLSLTCPEFRQRLADVGKTMTERLDRLDGFDPVTLHNDLHWNQIRVDGERFTFLDLERMATGDPLIDVANLATQMRMLGHRREFSVDVATAQAWAGEFLTQWERRVGKPINATRFRCYVVCSLFCLARGMMRHLRPGWRALSQTCLELAESQLSSTGREAMAT